MLENNTMKKKSILSLLFLTTFLLNGCKFYNFSGASTGTAESFQVNFFQNFADQSPGSIIEPGLDRDFTNALQDLVTNLTSLNLTSSGGDLIYEGEIVEYRIAPTTASANQTALENRLTMTVNVRFFNKTKEDADFEERFSFFFDFSGTQTLDAATTTAAHEEIFERITQDIFNRSLADW